MTRRREYFRITKFARKFDKRTGKFIINVAYKTKTDITDRTVAVGEAFGLGVDEFQKHVLYDNVELKIGPTDIVYITGDSGSGKSVLLRRIQRDLAPQCINIKNVKVDRRKPLVDTLGKSIEEALELLSRVGLNDAFLFVRRYSQLSDGQKYRYRIAKMIESGRQYWVMDEFCATLDRDTAKIVAFNVQKLARATGKAVLTATTHTDLFEDLRPSVHIHKRFGKEITVNYHANEPAKECSLTKEMCIERASLKEYKKLAEFHYRDSRSVPAPQKVFVLKRGEEIVGAIVYKWPGTVALGRLLALGRKIMLQELNRDFSLISRVVVHPKYRTIGLGSKMVRDTLFKCGRPYVESIAVMARYNPFFERAGMRKVAESTPNKRIGEAIDKLSEIGFNPVFLSSTKYNMEQIRNNPTTIEEVREILKEVSRRSGIYRKRLASIPRRPYPRHKEFCKIVDKAGIPKLARMLRILSFLAQKKVYLFWKSPALDFIRFLSEIRNQ